MSVTPVSTEFATYCEAVYGITNALYLTLSVGCAVQLIRMRIYRNSINPQFLFFLMVLLGSLCTFAIVVVVRWERCGGACAGGALGALGSWPLRSSFSSSRRTGGTDRIPTRVVG